MRRIHLEAVAGEAEVTVGSLQWSPPDARPFHIRVHAQPAKTYYSVTVALTPEQAAKLVADWSSMGGQEFRQLVRGFDKHDEPDLPWSLDRARGGS